MATTDHIIEQTEKRLAEVEALRATMRQAQEELNAYRELLSSKLAQLRGGEPAAEQAAEDILTAEEAPQESAIAEQADEGVDEAPAERRSSPRRKGNPVSVQVSHVAAGTEPFQGWVIDRSAGGLCLLVDQQVPPGRVLTVRPTKCRPGFPWIRVKVKNCRAERGSWNLGCQFEQRPSWSEMQQFG